MSWLSAAWRSHVAILIGSLSARRPATATQRSAPAFQPLPPRLTEAEQWSCVSRVVVSAVTSARTACRCQAAAAVQLDSASYAMQRMMEELATIMSVKEAPVAPVIYLEAAIRAERMRSALAA
jgi:hypothetical protein